MKKERRDPGTLDEKYGTEFICYLNYETPWQLLIATMLSAQCTDARVNIVTKRSVPEVPVCRSICGCRPERIRNRISNQRDSIIIKRRIS